MSSKQGALMVGVFLAEPARRGNKRRRALLSEPPFREAQSIGAGDDDVIQDADIDQTQGIT